MLHCSGEVSPEDFLPWLPGVVKCSYKEYAGFQDLSQIPVVTGLKEKNNAGDGRMFHRACDAVVVETAPGCSYYLQTLKSILNLPV